MKRYINSWGSLYYDDAVPSDYSYAEERKKIADESARYQAAREDYRFYIDDVYDGYGDYTFTVRSKSLPDFEAEVSVTEGFMDVEI